MGLVASYKYELRNRVHGYNVENTLFLQMTLNGRLTHTYNKFNFNGIIPGKSEKYVRPPTVIGAGAKKCGTFAFATFMAVNPQFRTEKSVEAHYLYKVYKDCKVRILVILQSDRWHKGFQNYAKSLPLTYENEVTYEGTPRYLVESVVPDRAKAINARYFFYKRNNSN